MVAANLVSIRSVKNPKTRDLLRGLLSRKLAPGEVRLILSKLLDDIEWDDLITIDTLLRSDRLFQHVEIASEFPSDSPFRSIRANSLVPPEPITLSYIAHRIGANLSNISAAISGFRALNVAIFSRDDASIVTAINSVLQTSGHSLTLLRKAAFVLGFLPKDTLSYQICSNLTASYGAKERNFGVMATLDAIGGEFNYLDLKYRFRDFASLEYGVTTSRKISHLCFYPIARRRDDFVPLVSASYAVSAIDALFAILVHQDLGFDTSRLELQPELQESWAELAAYPLDVFEYFKRGDSSADSNAFRAAPAFLENPAFRTLRASLQPLYDLPEIRDREQRDLTFPQHFFSGINRLDQLIPVHTPPIAALPKRFDNEAAGYLARSCAVVWVCEQNPDFSQMTAESMACLMGRTADIDRLLSTSTLRNAVATAADPFVKLILQTLLRAHSSATKDSFNFKSLFQQYVREHHGGNILSFIEKVRQLNSNIVQYYIELLDETLLSQMAFLMESSNSIYETRAQLLEWFADFSGDAIIRDKAKALRLDRKIAAVRGAINETRINIDSVRFRQWIEQNKLTEFSDFIRQKAPDLPTLADVTDRSKVQTLFLAAHREPPLRAMLAFVECYSEFCKNADYGIASFLGRRIRHGTLRGTLLKDVTDRADVDLQQGVLDQYQNWVRELSASIDSFASRLHFQDKSAHRDAIISADIDSVPKWQVCLVGLKAIFEQAQKDLGILDIPVMIEQYCWYILEYELSGVQAAIFDARSKWGTLKLRYNAYDTAAAPFERLVNITLSDHFNTVSSWFRKPPNISPVAEFGYVLEVVLKEASDEYATFTPELKLVGAHDLRLSGAIYYHVYDALTIAVRNAAKHGNHPGRLVIQSRIDDAGQGQALSISVSSQLRQGDSVHSAKSSIARATIGGAIGADVTEGLSGIRKLMKMKAERSLLDFAVDGCPAEPNGLRLDLRFAYTGLVE
ncbi:hypothetical protein [Sphingobium sp. B11D3D]|uniref:hypothetical protein n=1 Tax=Sphingobium sp. B11D3D TaxID=2940576 RepID=UPI00222406DA|nr:hypothetical protein [Sphingobium sp. B11D3D]MCW2370064.1 hypothetical protein [Sphingobium sp. B11D3D]